MSVVTYFVETSQAYLDTPAETQFGAVAATVGTLLVLGTTLVVILVGINMIYQYRAMDGHTAFWLAVKIGLIGIFATNWMQFNAFSSAILYGIDSIAGALVAGGSTATTTRAVGKKRRSCGRPASEGVFANTI